jgi:hypothetical protein
MKVKSGEMDKRDVLTLKLDMLREEAGMYDFLDALRIYALDTSKKYSNLELVAGAWDEVEQSIGRLMKKFRGDQV